MGGVTLAGSLRALRERWWVLLVAALIAALAAYVYTRLPFVEPRWKSSVWLQATGRFDYGNTLALERQLRPLAEQVRQLSIMREVDRNLNLDLPAEKMLSLVKAEPVQDSNQIRIDVEDADQVRSESIALEIAAVYSQGHNAQQQAKLREEQVLLTVLDRPSAATLVWPQTRVLVPVAALLAAVVAAGIVIGLHYLDDTLKSPRDVEQYLGLPLLGVVPRFKTAAALSGQVPTAAQPVAPPAAAAATRR